MPRLAWLLIALALLPHRPESATSQAAARDPAGPSEGSVAVERETTAQARVASARKRSKRRRKRGSKVSAEPEAPLGGRGLLAQACAAVRRRELESGRQLLQAVQTVLSAATGNSDQASAQSALLSALDSDLAVATAAQSGKWTDSDVRMQDRAFAAYEAAASQAKTAGVVDVELAALTRTASYAWAGRELARSIRAGRRILELVQTSGRGLMPAAEVAEAHTQLAISVLTLGSAKQDVRLHTEAVELLEAALRLAPTDKAVQAHTGAYLGFVLGQPLLRDYRRCAETLTVALDTDPTVRRQRDVAGLMVGTLDNCLTRIGQRERAQAVREFAVQVGVWSEAERQNDGVLVSFPGMRSAKFWKADELALLDTQGVFARLLLELGVPFPYTERQPQQPPTDRFQQLQAEAASLLNDCPACWVENREGIHEGGRWLEATLIALGGGGLANSSSTGAFPYNP